MRCYKRIFDKMAGKKNRKEGLKVERASGDPPEEKRKNREAGVVLLEVSNPVNPGNNSSLV